MAAPKKPKKASKGLVKSQQDQGTAGLDSAFATRTAGLEETDKLYERAKKKLDAQLATQNLINEALKDAKGLTEEQATAAGKLTKMWGDFESLAAKYHQDVKDGVMTQEQANKKLREMRVGFDRMLKTSELNTKETKDLLQVFKDMGSEMKSVEKAYDKTAKKAGLLNAAIDHVGSSGVPLMQEFGGVLKNVVEKNAEGARLAMTALGAAAGALSMKYFGAETEAGTKALNDAAQNQIDGQREILKLANKRKFITQRADLESRQNNINTYGELNKLEQKKGFVSKQIGLEVNQNSIDTANEVNRLTIEAAHSSQRAAIQFSAQLKTGAAEFNASAKTALYGKGIGSIGYGAAQMQLAGVGAENVAASLKEATKALGTKVTSEVAADMAVLEKRTGASAEGIASMVSFYKRLDGASDATALNMAEGMRSMADSAGIDLGGYMEEVAQASKEALGYQIKSGPALQKQVAYAQQLGVSFGDIAKAGKSMVLNYKDSIKKEMELSAMLGRNVNLSEARALFSQGKTDEALKSIKAQGLDPKAMNMFQQEALSQALGGLDLDALQKIATGSATDVSAQKGNVKAGNKGFLSATQSAQSTLASQTASIQAQTAIVDAQLSGQITKAYLQSDGYKQYQKNLLQQQKDQALLENEITNSYLKSPAYQKYQSFLLGQQMAESKLNTLEENTFITSAGAIKNAADAAKLGIERMFTENWRSGLAAAAGAVGGNIVGKGIEKLFGGVQKVYVVNQDGGSDLSDVSDGPDSSSKNKKTRTRTTRTPKGPRGGSKMSKIFNSAKNLLPKITNSLKPTSLLKGGAKLLKGGLPGIIGGLALNAFAENQAAKGNKKMAAGADIASSALSGAGYGAMIGSIIPGVGNVVGGAVGGVLGGAYGLYQNWGAFGSPAAPAKGTPSKAKTPPKAGTTTVVGTPGAPGGVASVPAGMLSAAEYQVKLQIKMVQLMGVSAALLEAILLETDSKPVLSVNGIKLNQQLMASSLKTMAVNRRDGGTPRM
jgi:hypothetical protein